MCVYTQCARSVLQKRVKAARREATEANGQLMTAQRQIRVLEGKVCV